jgi:hypothetical protein
MRLSRVINTIGAAMSMTVLVVVLITKFQAGAKYAILAMAFLFVIMLGINRHYRHGQQGTGSSTRTSASSAVRVHAVVLVSKLHKPALRALAYARATRPTTLEALTVEVDPDDATRAGSANGTGSRSPSR